MDGKSRLWRSYQHPPLTSPRPSQQSCTCRLTKPNPDVLVALGTLQFWLWQSSVRKSDVAGRRLSRAAGTQDLLGGGEVGESWFPASSLLWVLLSSGGTEIITMGCSQGLKTAPPCGWGWGAHGMVQGRNLAYVLALNDQKPGYINQQALHGVWHWARSLLTHVPVWTNHSVFFSVTIYFMTNISIRKLCPTSMWLGYEGGV